MNDEAWMRLAIAEGCKGVGKTAPNPAVGAVVVKDGILLGSGWHRAAGRPHAEREALVNVLGSHGPEAARGSTIYVTLEPCSTFGRTPPCTQGLIDAGVARVVYACTDPAPAHSGRADAMLEAHGIQVRAGVLADEAFSLIRPFAKWIACGLPWVIWKCAMSLDGRITRPPGESRWLTGEAARADVQRLRAEVDAVLTSGETVRRDHPALTIRDADFAGGRDQPWRVVFTDKPESLPREAPLFSDRWCERTLIRPCGDLEASLRNLAADQGVRCALVEAGGVFSSALVEAGLIDEIVVYYAPMLCGGPVPALAGNGLPAPHRLTDIRFEALGDDLKLRARILRTQMGSGCKS
ncbi:MAG: bifunctional diaminohydroxyphosphoribosylaminopyrimidine deaminase/5-amino-6-(5-phosphoribosylamino)uracil reductase RibD [Verrucomicrobia bacterium]|nr:bifunctional diaminohydroxyphosphoribosylaminopyrimidine deaminase/5-amino-6-(5-phosphoribosylamino)uracil reductase RibD [Verrucomicrobiota bacterium]